MSDPFRFAEPTHNEQTLVEVLDRVLDIGVVVQGDLTISVADVDLLYVGLKAILCTPDKLQGLAAPASSIHTEGCA